MGPKHAPAGARLLLVAACLTAGGVAAYAGFREAVQDPAIALILTLLLALTLVPLLMRTD
jgi:hypothetical protein